MSSDSRGSSPSLLLVEDDGYCQFFIKNVLQASDIRIETAERDSSLTDVAAANDFDAVVLSFRGISRNDLSMVNILHEDNPKSPVIAVSERAEVDFALEVLRAGAFDYLTRPFRNAARVQTALSNAFLESKRLRHAADPVEGKRMEHGMVGRSKLVLDILRRCRQIGPLNVNVLINGESGTGKELIARAIHAESGRRTAPFQAVNCGAIPEGLVESIFFGHEKGAFTGAVHSHAGIMEKADGGTVFLDEVGELSPKGQVALLRFMEDREFIRVGGTRARTSDVRIIAATNRNLEGDVEKSTFRADLYYRLNVVHFIAPSLRHRPEDILPLADFFLKRFCLRNNLRPIKISARAANVLAQYSWPGNVRELENLMEGLAATLPPNRGTLAAEDILEYSGKIKIGLAAPDPRGHPLHEKTFKEAQAAFEIQYLQGLLKKFKGNVARAARHADIHPVTLHRKLKKFQLQ